MEITSYKDSNIDEEILRGIQEMGFTDMTPIQAMTIPVLLAGKDIIGQAQTGTGKTAAFGIPMIQKIDQNEAGIQGLVLCPTRELAMQGAEELRKLAKYTHGVKIVPIYGGQDIDKQIRLLKGKVSIIVGTPGRVMDHMRRRTLKFQNLKMLVLDEADEMLNMGFREDIETICQDVPEERQTALFSATMPKAILEITRQYQRDAQLMKVDEEELTIPLVKQYFYVIKGREKDESLCRLIDYVRPKKALVFCNTKRKVDELTLALKARGYYSEGLHGDMSQNQRDRVMNLFRNGKLEILIATDVAARGLDIDDVEIVYNYDLPQEIEYYVHRIGRTGRAGKKGKAYSLVTGREIYKIKSLEKFCHTTIRERQLPTAATVNVAKAVKTLDDAVEYGKNKDLDAYIEMINKKNDEESISPLQIAASFLRMNIGELADESLDDSASEESGSREGRSRDGKSRRGGSRDGSARSYGKPNYAKSKENGSRDGRYRDKSRDSKDSDGKARDSHRGYVGGNKKAVGNTNGNRTKKPSYN